MQVIYTVHATAAGGHDATRNNIDVVLAVG